jgi:cadmium resistance protein CadD (predicted permease)
MKTGVAALLAEMLLFGLVPIAFGIWQIRSVNQERRKRQQERDQQADQQGDQRAGRQGDRTD